MPPHSPIVKPLIAKIPVTILTGFLGSGKTTLLNRILQENHGKRIAVIENEFGEVGVDNDLVIGADEEIFEMNNGCICCTVRGDLIRILNNLIERREQFDYLVIETTGLADPGPVVQTFILEESLRDSFSVDAVVTVVDAMFIEEHIDDDDKAKEQIAFADVILLNKIDLVEEAAANHLEEWIQRLNAIAPVHRTVNATIDMDKILNQGGFNVEKALAFDPEFLEPDHSFDWIGLYHFAAGYHQWLFHPGPEKFLNVALVPVFGNHTEVPESVIKTADSVFTEAEDLLHPNEKIEPGLTLNRLMLEDKATAFQLHIRKPGLYALVSESLPKKYSAAITYEERFIEPVSIREFIHHHHHHNHEITSVGISIPGDLKLEVLETWIQILLTAQGRDILRMKGVLSIKDRPERFIFQGIHRLVDGDFGRPWGDEERVNNLVFIGRNLDRDFLNKGFKACLI